MRRRPVLGVSLVLTAVSWALMAPPAAAAPYPPLAELTVLPYARLVDGGDAVRVRVRILCQPSSDVLRWEGFANADQGDVEGFAELELRCDGRRHVQDVLVDALGDPEDEDRPRFAPGPVEVRVVLVDENTLTVHASDTRTVRVH